MRAAVTRRGAAICDSFRQPFDPLGASEPGHWLCVPGSHRVCSYREAGEDSWLLWHFHHYLSVKPNLDLNQALFEAQLAAQLLVIGRRSANLQ